jgi:uncharacterized protein YaeQ
MSFVDRFIGFSIDLTSSERSLYKKIRLKLPLYPNESRSALVARVLTYLLCYRENLHFSSNPSESSEPTIYAEEIDQSFSAFVGLPDFKALRLLARRSAPATCAVYFYTKAQLTKFCHDLRGTKENWVERCRFFILHVTPEQIDTILPEEASSVDWQIIEIDSTLYLEGPAFSVALQLEALDIWDAYQQSLSSGEPNEDR